jgi:hypothetical protein
MSSHTGGFSSRSSPLVGFALRFAKTPSFCPAPYVLSDLVDPPKMGSCVTLLSIPFLGRIGVSSLSSLASGCNVSGFPRIKRCRSSTPSERSSSLPSSSLGESKVSASVRSASLARGSSESRPREAPVGDDARLRKEGGGESGIEYGCCASRGEETASSSCSATYRYLLAHTTHRGREAWGETPYERRRGRHTRS